MQQRHRHKKKPQQPKGEITVPVSNVQKTDKKYDLRTMQEVVRTKCKYLVYVR